MDIGKAPPLWLLRALAQTKSPVMNRMYLEDKETGNPQTIYSASHPLGLLSIPPYQYTPGKNTEAIMYPQIRWRSPGLERLTEDQAYREAMGNQDYMKFPTLWDANIFAQNLTKKIKRKKKP